MHMNLYDIENDHKFDFKFEALADLWKLIHYALL